MKGRGGVTVEDILFGQLLNHFDVNSLTRLYPQLSAEKTGLMQSLNEGPAL